MKYDFFQGILLNNMDYGQVLEGRLEFVEYTEGMKNYNRKERNKIKIPEKFRDRICSMYRGCCGECFH